MIFAAICLALVVVPMVAGLAWLLHVAVGAAVSEFSGGRDWVAGVAVLGVLGFWLCSSVHWIGALIMTAGLAHGLGQHRSGTGFAGIYETVDDVVRLLR